MNKINRTLWGMVKIATYCLIIFGIIGLLTVFIVLPQWVKSNEIVVPNLIGKPIYQAINTLKFSGLQAEKYIEQASSDQQKGYVIKQHPLAYTDVKPHQKVKLTVSSGADLTPIPSVIGKSEDAAHETLVNAGFKAYSVAHVHSDNYYPNTVIAQNPAEGIPKLRNSRVNLLISLGRKTQNIRLPDLQNQLVEDVLPILKDVGLDVEIRRIPHPRIKEGRIITHKKIVQSGDLITLDVSGRQGDTQNTGRWLTHRHTVSGEDNLSRKVKIVIIDDYRQRTVVDATFASGTVIDLERRRVRVFGPTLVIVYENNIELYQKQYR